MASRRSLRKQPEREPQGRRRSLRVASQKAVPFNHQRSVAYQAPTTSALMDFATPRTVLKKVLQTQPIVSPFVSEKPDSPKPIDTIFHFPEKTDSSISLEVSLSDLSQRQKSKITRHPTRSKKIRLSVFERDLNNQLHSSTDQGLLDHTSLTKSLQISFTTPAPLNSAGKKGLMRRPKHYRGVNVKDFEGGLEQGLLQIKDSAENYPEDQKTTTLQSNNTEAQSVETELFLPPHSSEENNVELSNVPPEPDLVRQSLGDGRAPSLSQTRLARQDEISDMGVEKVAESFPKEILAPGSKRTIEAETECTEEKDDRSKGRCQESPEGAEKGLRLSLGKENLSPGSEDASSTESISQKRRVTPQRQEQKNFHGNSPDEELSTPKQPLKTGLGARSSFSTWLSRKAARRPMNELVAHITQELDNLLPGVAGRQGLAKVDLEKGSSLREKTVEISQSPRVRTPNRRASGKTPKKLERTPFKEMRERTNPHTGGRNRTKEMRNVETEQILEFETEGNSEVEEMSESEDIAVEISQSPRVVTPNRRASGKTPKSLERTPFKEMRERTNPQTGGRNKTTGKRNVETEQILEFEDEDNPEVEMSESEDIAIENSQSPRVVTPKRRASGKTPKSLERTPFKEMRERTNPQTGGRNKTKEMRNVETEQILEFETEGNSEVEMSESEDIAVEISQSPRVVTPKRRASGKTPKSLERTPFKEMRERTNPQTGGRNKTTGKRNVETEQILEFEDEDNPEVEMSESEDIAIENSQSPRVVTPKRRASGKTPKSLERTPFKEMRERTNPQTGGRNKTKEMRNVETEQILEFETEGNSEVEMSESEDIAVEISQSPRVVTPKRRASGKTPKSLERTPFKEMRERTNPQTGGRNKTKEMRNVETEQILEFETEGNSEVEMSESEDIAVEISQSPRVVTPKRRASGKTPKSLERTPFKEMRERTNPQTGGRNKTAGKRNVETEQILEFEDEDNPEVEMSESEDIAVEISQSPRVVTSNRRASGKTPKSLERTPFKEMRERTNPQTGGRNKTAGKRNVETEQILEFETEGNSEVEEMSEAENIAVEISQSPRVVTPKRRASGKTPKSLERTPFKEMRERTNPQTGGRNKTKEMRNVETEQILEFETEGNSEVEMSESEDIAVEISQSPRVVTPKRRASGKTPKSLERTPFKEMRERTNPQTGGRNKTAGKRNVETEQILEFEDEDNPEVEMSESEDIAIEISQSPRVVTPNRRASGKTPKSLERTPFKEMSERTNPQTGGRNRTKEMRNVETEQILEFETEGNSEIEEMSEAEDIAIEISQSPRVVTPNRRASGKTPKSLERTPFKEMRERTNPQTGGRNKTKEMRNVETEQILEFEDEDNPEVEMSESEDIAIENSQSPRVVTPKRRASGKTPKSLERMPFKEMRERTNPQTGGRNKTTGKRNVETEQILEFEDEDNPEVEEMSESENIEPTGNTPAFVRAKAFHCTPLLASPRVLKEVASGSPVKQDSVQQLPKPAKKACPRKREPSLPNNLVKKLFTHHVKMPVTKEALEIVERCVNVYFKHLSNDLDAYVTHAGRKIADPADVELLMKRQGLITDKMPLHVLVERHLPFEYRKLLIPVATSGNKVIPQKPK